MALVLGIDAAWTAGQPSGVALAGTAGSGWRLVAAVPSYRDFLGSALAAPLTGDATGMVPDAAALLAAGRALGGSPVDLVAIDMPLSAQPVVARRAADNAVSRAYGGRACSTHSPSAARPGRISDDLRRGFDAAGYPLRTLALAAPGLIEVYPHPALVELAGAAMRLPYKAAKTRRYWPGSSPEDRHARLRAEWARIVALLEREIAGVQAALPPPPLATRGRALKAYEDMLDAVVCAWIGVCALEGRALAFGDADAAIWIPAPRALGHA